MRIFLAGASGVVGRRLVPRLAELGHEVTGMTRTAAKADAVRALGAEPVVCDALNPEGLRETVVAVRPEVVIQHLTDLPQRLKPRAMKRAYQANDRIRTEGTPNLVRAALDADVRRIVAQSIAFIYAPRGSWVKSEAERIYDDAPPPFDDSVRAIRGLERSVLDAPGIEGLALRFGFFYGPGTTYAADGYTAGEVRRRRFPIVGKGTGTFSFIHVDDVVSATIAALDRGSSGSYNVVDDDPAPVAEWLPLLADAVGAKRPRRVPLFIARLMVGGFPAYMMTELRGASNEKAKRELGWEPRWSSWRQGFRDALG